jgi:GNAT superfamily N-acetyltransferase
MRHRTAITVRKGSIPDIELLLEIDADASRLFEQAGLRLHLTADHEFSLAERSFWLQCLAAGTVLIAQSRPGHDVGFAAVGIRDGEPYLDQLSVRCRFMGQGIGTELLHASLKMARQAEGTALWLATYDHLSWNRPYYERHGFVLVAPEHWGPEINSEVLYQSRWLPRPEERVIKRKDLTATDPERTGH